MSWYLHGQPCNHLCMHVRIRTTKAERDNHDLAATKRAGKNDAFINISRRDAPPLPEDVCLAANMWDHECAPKHKLASSAARPEVPLIAQSGWNSAQCGRARGNSIPNPAPIDSNTACTLMQLTCAITSWCATMAAAIIIAMKNLGKGGMGASRQVGATFAKVAVIPASQKHHRELPRGAWSFESILPRDIKLRRPPDFDVDRDLLPRSLFRDGIVPPALAQCPVTGVGSLPPVLTHLMALRNIFIIVLRREASRQDVTPMAHRGPSLVGSHARYIDKSGFARAQDLGGVLQTFCPTRNALALQPIFFRPPTLRRKSIYARFISGPSLSRSSVIQP